MKITRRSLLGSVFWGAPIAFGAIPTALFAADCKPFMLLLDGITPATAAPDLFSFLDPIVSQGIPVGCILHLDPAVQAPFADNPDLARLLVRLGTDYPGLVEIVLAVPGLARAEGYLRMRGASDAQSAYLRAFAPFADTRRRPALTVATDLPDTDVPEMDGLRAAGFRSVILLPQDNARTAIWRTDDGAQQVLGGHRLSAKDDISKAVTDEIATGDLAVLVAGFPDDPDLDQDGIFQKGAALGDGVSAARWASSCFMTLPSDLALKSGDRFRRQVVLCLTDEGAGENLAALADRLDQRAIPYTRIRDVAVDQAQSAPGQAPETCWRAAATKQAFGAAAQAALGGLARPDGAAADGRVACVAVESLDDTAKTDDYGGLDVLVELTPSDIRTVGLDRDGVLRIAAGLTYGGIRSGQRVADLRAEVAAASGPLQDTLVVIPGAAVTSAGQVEAVVAALASLAQDEDVVLTDLSGYVRTVTVEDQPARLLKMARRIPGKPLAVAPETKDHDRLMQDARLAWSYFDRFSDPDSGLAPATAWLEDGKVVTYNFATMWDIATQIQATISAHSIGLLDDTQFQTRMARVLAHLSDAKFGDLTLPTGMSSTTGKKAELEDYNASDTSRLLVALKVLTAYSSFDFGVQKIVSRWDLAKTIRDGMPQTMIAGRLQDAYQSNYAGYLARGFREWGFDITSPYPPVGQLTGMDADVATLYAVADLGPVGTEPHLLEAVELGYSDAARVSAEALFAAQVDAYRTGGELVCVSEGPIDREPWFIYQGYQVDDTENPWTTETLSTSERFTTRGFRRAVSMVNSKAAYLWHAVRAGDYTALLVDHIREHAKLPALGFAPGVLSITGVPSSDYSDNNTNGIILQAIAFSLNGARPAIEWRARAAATK